jgi:hypothetical protein
MVVLDERNINTASIPPRYREASQLPVAWRIVVGHAENSALSPFQEHNYDY